RRRIFSVTVAAFQSFHPSAQPHHVVVDKHQVLLGISVRKIRGRDQISAVGGEKCQPVIQPPSVQNSRFLEKKLLLHLAQSGRAVLVSGGACFRHDCCGCYRASAALCLITGSFVSTFPTPDRWPNHWRQNARS